ncbi:MAG TPA: hypothetical protein VNF68_10385, partial [Candidatus Baltobacteraceae bacterium]|nr:hypothetical protein [Candidatus Baltobacteraceae bacterium]
EIGAREGAFPHTAQRGMPSTTKPIARADLDIDWSWDPRRIVDHVRAFSPRPGARAVIDGETVKILRAHVSADGRLQIDQLVAPNRGKMSGAQYEQSRASRSGTHEASRP